MTRPEVGADGHTASPSPDAEQEQGRRRVVGVLADPDRPAELARSLAGDGRLARRLGQQLAELEPSVDWDVQVRVNALAEQLGDLPDVFDAADRRRRAEEWDWVVYLTDLPVRTAGSTVVADVDTDLGVAALSLPALGGIALHRRVTAVMVRLVARLTGTAAHAQGDPDSGLRRVRRAASMLSAPVQPTDAPSRDVEQRLTVPGWRGRMRLLAGMLRANHPGQLLVGMATAFAATTAASAFMIFNSSTWRIATSAGLVRLGPAVLAGMVLLVAWIVVRHGLWEGRHDQPDRELRRLYNLATLATVGQGVVALATATFLVDLGAVLLLITPEALSATLERPPIVTDWFAIATLATVAATLAGALGVGLQREQDVRNAAYGYRQREHQRLARDAQG
ncbi:hypothetical protein [Actinomycetospora cinnamomea]|uniref:Uncharacterized protein n=1 Tax=Actinomycetospora cinnamomea TaxID=663609 RepID=A0A2U1F3V3_9PSEU|nr:hypothetical protein [Actinomycetospora cinnamomea]PVZ06863.1 hypothetical protein C8D89_11256 [Actinomycetospora cinnamomea]